MRKSMHNQSILTTANYVIKYDKCVLTSLFPLVWVEVIWDIDTDMTWRYTFALGIGVGSALG